MGFKAKYDSTDMCPKCKEGIGSGDLVQYADADRKILEHVDCDVSDERLEPQVLRWENVTEESLDRAELLDQEMARVAPLAKEGKCPRCNIELPKTKVCGYC